MVCGRFFAFQKLKYAYGALGTVSIDGVECRTHPDEPNEQRRIAEYAHRYAEFLWDRAKAEADRQKAELERQKEVELERIRSLEQFDHDIQRIQSNQRLAFRETEIRESIRSAKNKAEETLFRQQLEFIQTRMIQLEKRINCFTASADS